MTQLSIGCQVQPRMHLIQFNLILILTLKNELFQVRVELDYLKNVFLQVTLVNYEVELMLMSLNNDVEDNLNA
jgi:hypothetical protein